MCLIIETKKHLPISQKLLLDMQSKNDDGWGMMWRQDNVLKVVRNPSHKFEELWATYQELAEFEPIIHLRMRTHGEIDITNTHPFYCGYGIFMMHNGVISVNQKDEKKSDTWHFVEGYVKPLFSKAKNPHKMIRHPKFQEEFMKIVGYGNRIVFADRGGHVIPGREKNWECITNEDTGCKGLWVSNSYAWSCYSFGKKQAFYSLGQTSSQLPIPLSEQPLPQNKSQSTVYIGSTRGHDTGHGKCEVDPLTGHYMWQIIGIIWQDAFNKRFYRTDTGHFKRAAGLDNICIETPHGRYAERVKEPAPKVIEAEFKEVQNTPIPFMLDAQLVKKEFPQGYLGVMTRRLKEASKEVLEIFVKRDPIEAATILQHVLKDLHV